MQPPPPRRPITPRSTGIWQMYKDYTVSRPLTTAVLTGLVCCALADLVAQASFLTSTRAQCQSNRAQQPPRFATLVDEKAKYGTYLDFERLKVAALEGALVQGALAVYWFKFLDVYAVPMLGLASGSAAAYALKLSLQLTIWHPFSLFASYCLCMLDAEGYGDTEVLKNDLYMDAFYKFPIDLFLFSRGVPPSLQVFVWNCGWFNEALACGFLTPRVEPPPAAPPTP